MWLFISRVQSATGKAIAAEGQKGQKVTVIASIHQPSSQVGDIDGWNGMEY